MATAPIRKPTSYSLSVPVFEPINPASYFDRRLPTPAPVMSTEDYLDIPIRGMQIADKIQDIPIEQNKRAIQKQVQQAMMEKVSPEQAAEVFKNLAVDAVDAEGNVKFETPKPIDPWEAQYYQSRIDLINAQADKARGANANQKWTLDGEPVAEETLDVGVSDYVEPPLPTGGATTMQRTPEDDVLDAQEAQINADRGWVQDPNTGEWTQAAAPVTAVSSPTPEQAALEVPIDGEPLIPTETTVPVSEAQEEPTVVTETAPTQAAQPTGTELKQVGTMNGTPIYQTYKDGVATGRRMEILSTEADGKYKVRMEGLDKIQTIDLTPSADSRNVPESLRAEALDLGVQTYGRTVGEIEKDVLDKRKEGGVLSQRQVQRVNQLQTKLGQDPIYKDVFEIKSAYDAMNESFNQKNGVGDIGMINSYQRIIDPGVSVREGDIKVIQSARSLVDRLNPENLKKKLLGGDRLPEETRRQMKQVADDIYRMRVKNFNEITGVKYKKLADSYGIPYEVLDVDFGVPIEESGTSFGSEAEVQDAFKKGTVKAGDTVVVNGQKFKVEQ